MVCELLRYSIVYYYDTIIWCVGESCTSADRQLKHYCTILKTHDLEVTHIFLPPPHHHVLFPPPYVHLLPVPSAVTPSPISHLPSNPIPFNPYSSLSFTFLFSTFFLLTSSYLLFSPSLCHNLHHLCQLTNPLSPCSAICNHKFPGIVPHLHFFQLSPVIPSVWIRVTLETSFVHSNCN